MRVKWWGVASAVTGSPRALAWRTSSTDPGGGEVLEVDPGAGEPGQGDVAEDHQLLGLGRDAGDARARRPLPLVHVAAVAERLDLAVLGEGDPAREARRVLERPAHEPVVLHAARRRR